MNSLEEFQSKIAASGCLKLSSSKGFLKVEADEPSGFDVWISRGRKDFTVGFDGWHEEFTSLTGAAECFAFGVFGRCRLKVLKKGRYAYRWTLESWNESAWQTESETGLLLFPYWRKTTVEYLENHRSSSVDLV